MAASSARNVPLPISCGKLGRLSSKTTLIAASEILTAGDYPKISKIQSDGGTGYVAKSSGIVVGVMAVKEIEGGLELTHLVTRSDCRRRGVGDQMLMEVKKLASYIILFPETDNAKNFYLKRGFAVYPTAAHYLYFQR
jgi:ribosomal protein S18 acetylase RimI-like enzyme